MKYLIDFRIFSESMEVKETDPADVQTSKEKVNAMEKWMQEFPVMSKKIDDIYKKNLLKPENIDKQVDELLGKDPKSRNPFLVEYQTVSKLNFDVKKLTDEILTSESKISLVTSPIAKAELVKNLEIKKKKLSDLQTQVTKAKADLDKKMIDIKKENDDASKKIATQEKK